MSTETEPTTQVHGGRLVARRLKARGVSKLFTLSGGHLFSIYDGCREEGIDIVDVRHESAAAFAAEGWAKVTRRPGVAALTAGPGVTNGMSALAAAQQNNSPMLVLGGRAPAMRWGQGSLQEIDHVPFTRPVTKLAATPEGPDEIAPLVDEALAVALTPPTGPTFLDFPADHELFFSRARSKGLNEADVALVVGVPMDFRLGFGGSFGEETEIVALDYAPPPRDHPRPVAAELYGAVPEALAALREAAGGAVDSEAWIAALRPAG